MWPDKRKSIVAKIFIDVREHSEFVSDHVEGALNIPLSELKSTDSTLTTIPKGATIILYCQSGGRSQMAMRLLKNLGYKNVTNGINRSYIEANYLYE